MKMIYLLISLIVFSVFLFSCSIDKKNIIDSNVIEKSEINKTLTDYKTILDKKIILPKIAEDLKFDENKDKIYVLEDKTKYGSNDKDKPIQIEIKKTDKHKYIIVSSSKHYFNVSSSTDLNDIDLNSIRLYHFIDGKRELVKTDIKFNDKNKNGLIDSVDWIVPHLSDELYELILVTDAEHLDENKTFIKNIYDDVKSDDDNHVLINNGEYVRAYFEKPLSNKSMIYVVVNGSLNSKIEIYEYNKTELIATMDNTHYEYVDSYVDNLTNTTIFYNVTNYKIYSVKLENLTNTEQDAFDFKVYGNISFDFIIDPVSAIINITLNSSSGNNVTTDNITCSFSLNDTTTSSSIAWYVNDTPLMFYYLPMEAGLTNGLIDYSGNGFNTTRVGNTWSASRGVNGFGSYVFDGSGYLQFTESNTQFLTDNFTITFWINGTNWATGADQNLIYKLNFPEATILLTSDGSTGEIYYTDGSCLFTTGTLGVSSNNKYYFIAVVINGTTRDIYINTTKYTNSSCDNGIINDGTNRLRIGGIDNTGSDFVGALDDFRIYNRTLSQTQINQIFNERANITRSTIVSNELKLNDVWRCEVTPFNSTTFGSLSVSNNLTIVSASLCTFLSGFCNLQCNQTLNRNVDANSFNVSINGNGTFNMNNYNITNTGKDFIINNGLNDNGCDVIMNGDLIFT